jgi:hypothetical protein
MRIGELDYSQATSGVHAPRLQAGTLAHMRIFLRRCKVIPSAEGDDLMANARNTIAKPKTATLGAKSWRHKSVSAVRAAKALYRSLSMASMAKRRSGMASMFV